MSRYSPEFLERVLGSDEFDVLVPEFIARSTEKVARAGAVIHDCQTETTKMSIDIATELGNAGIKHDDPFFATVIVQFDSTSKAQSRMWDAMADIAESMAKVVKRQ